MAKEDFCFTYYDGDAARDKAHMTRLQRGAYDDIISAQRKKGHLSIDDIKRVLSKDFEECWPALEWVLKKDAEENFFIEWVDKSIEKMRRHSEKQRDNVAKRWGKNEPGTRNDRMAKAKLKGDHSEDDWHEMRAFFKVCVCCQENENVCKEHIIAVSIGGSNSINNIQPLCAYCNAKKGTRIIDYRQIYAIKNNITLPEKYQLDTKNIPSYVSGINLEEPLEDGNGNGDGNINGFKEGGMGETIPRGIVPDMLQAFKDNNPGYPTDQTVDFPALLCIGNKIVAWQKLPGDITGAKNIEVIKSRWGELVPFIRSHTLFGGYSLAQVNKHFQSIVQSFNSNGNKQKGSTTTKQTTSTGHTGL